MLVGFDEGVRVAHEHIQRQLRELWVEKTMRIPAPARSDLHELMKGHLDSVFDTETDQYQVDKTSISYDEIGQLTFRVARGPGADLVVVLLEATLRRVKDDHEKEQRLPSQYWTQRDMASSADVEFEFKEFEVKPYSSEWNAVLAMGEIL